MAEQTTFGRRRAVPARAPARPSSEPEVSSRAMEALAASVREARANEADEFARWHREQRPRRILMIALRFGLLAPGLICFAFQTPWWISVGLEVAGLAANAWLRGERTRQASAIAGWSPES